MNFSFLWSYSVDRCQYFILGDIATCERVSLDPYFVSTNISQDHVFMLRQITIAIGKADSNVTLSQLSSIVPRGFPVILVSPRLLFSLETIPVNKYRPLRIYGGMNSLMVDIVISFRLITLDGAKL